MHAQPVNHDDDYNLLDERWIPVTFRDGTAGDVSLTELLTNASDIQTISGELPQMKFAIMRLALAVLYRMQEFPDASRDELIEYWSNTWENGKFDHEDLLGYLGDVHDRFYLFDEKMPFYQVAGLSYLSGEAGPVSSIIPDVPKADRYLFSMRAPQCAEEISYAEAARYLVMAHAYDISGIKSPVVGNTHVSKGKVYAPKGALGTGWCGAIGGVILEGDNLFQDLMLNWVLYDEGKKRPLLDVPGDVPPWERAPQNPDIVQREPRGPVDLLTWQSRRIRLVRDSERGLVTGVVLCYGDILTVPDKQSAEMMTAWRESPQQQKKLGLPHVPWMPLAHDPGKALWRGLPALISYGAGSTSDQKVDLTPGVVRWARALMKEDACPLSESTPFSIHAPGLSYGTQSAVIDDAIDDSVSMSMLLLRPDAEAQMRVLDVIARAEEAVRRLVLFVERVESSGGDKRRYDSFGDSAADAVKNDVRERAYENLDQLFRIRLANFTPEKDPYVYHLSWCEEACRTLRSCARTYVAESGTSLFAERGNMTAGRALVLFDRSLNKIFGIAPAGTPAPGDENTGREDHV